MRTKKRIVLLTVIILVVSAVVYTTALLAEDNCASRKLIEWIKTVFSGALASTIVAFFIAISEYFSERHAAVEEFCEATYRLMYYYRGLIYYDSDIRTDKKAFSEALQQYRTLIAAVKQNSLSHSYGNLDFVFANKRVRGDIAYRRIYKYESSARDALLKLDFHISVYDKAIRKGGTSNQMVLADKMIDVQKRLFEETYVEGLHKVYRFFEFNIDSAMYDLLQFLYGSNNVEKKPKKDNYLCYATGANQGNNIQ